MSKQRSCGSCNLCCDLLEINEISVEGQAFAKRAWSLCRHCDVKGKDGCCTIHATRPRTCRDYSCAWLMGFGGDDDRPDKVRVLVHPEESEGFGPMLNFNELEAGVTSSHPSAIRLLQHAKAVAWINAVSIVPSADAQRKVYVRDKQNPELWEVRWYESFREQFPDGYPLTDWREVD